MKNELYLGDDDHIKPCKMWKWQLAKLYSPEATTHSAVNSLKYWIKLNNELLKALEESGYDRNQKKFTAKQVALIFKHLGEP